MSNDNFPAYNGSDQVYPVRRPKSLALSYILLIFIGNLGIHAFYLRMKRLGLTHLIVTIVCALALGFGAARFPDLVYLGNGEIIPYSQILQYAVQQRLGMAAYLGAIGLYANLASLFVEAFYIPRWVRQNNAPTW